MTPLRAFRQYNVGVIYLAWINAPTPHPPPRQHAACVSGVHRLYYYIYTLTATLGVFPIVLIVKIKLNYYFVSSLFLHVAQITEDSFIH